MDALILLIETNRFTEKHFPISISSSISSGVFSFMVTFLSLNYDQIAWLARQVLFLDYLQLVIFALLFFVFHFLFNPRVLFGRSVAVIVK